MVVSMWLKTQPVRQSTWIHGQGLRMVIIRKNLTRLKNAYTTKIEDINPNYIARRVFLHKMCAQTKLLAQNNHQ